MSSDESAATYNDSNGSKKLRWASRLALVVTTFGATIVATRRKGIVCSMSDEQIEPRVLLAERSTYSVPGQLVGTSLPASARAGGWGKRRKRNDFYQRKQLNESQEAQSLAHHQRRSRTYASTPSPAPPSLPLRPRPRPKRMPERPARPKSRRLGLLS